MNKAIMQLWEYYEKCSDDKSNIRSSGCSIHTNSEERIKYINSIYSERMEPAPNEYENTLGEEMEVFIDDKLFTILQKEKSIKIAENQLNNLINMGELIIKP
jgi:hypothetical protein